MNTVSAVDEREALQALLDLADAESPDELVARAARLLARLTGAREAYVELFGDDVEGAIWSAAEGCEGERVREIRTLVSRGIVSEAIATGQTVMTDALSDPRFAQNESVRAGAIHAVLCAPIGTDAPVGVLYAHGQVDDTLGSFRDDARRWIELLARQLAPLASRFPTRGRAPAAAERQGANELDRLVLRSRVFRQTIERLRHAAPLDVHILLTGPSGVGKTMLAHAVHACSGRAQRPFVELNCAALPETLFENELFGADPGAHSAVPRGGSKGKVEAADGGTLFLDEIGELSLSAQAKLLQLLQSKSYFRLGSAQLRRADIRVIAATNTNLEARVRERTFREDLYYRLNVLQVRVPALSEREEDLVPLSVQLCRDACLRHDLPVIRLSPGSLRAIAVAPWPGNVRELMHRIESAVLNAHLRSATAVEAHDVFPDQAHDEGPEAVSTLQEATRRFQKRHVASVLESTDWNVSEAARLLDVARSHVYNLIRAFDLRRGG